MKEHPYIEELGRFTAYMRTNLPYARTRRFARNTPYTAVSPSESPLHFADRRDESVIVGYYTSAEVPSPRRRQPSAPLGELSVRRIHIAHRRCEQGFQGAQHPLAQNAHPTDLSLKSTYRKKANRLYGDHFRITVEPVIVKKYRKTLANRGFYKKKLDTRFDTYCIKTGVQLWWT